MLLETFKVWEQYFSSDSYIVGFSVQVVAFEDGFLHKSTSMKNSLEALPKKSDRSDNGDVVTNLKKGSLDFHLQTKLTIIMLHVLVLEADQKVA